MDHESDVGLGIGIFLIIGLVVSFIPQYYKIISSKSVEGISHWSQGLNNISCFCALFGAFMLDYHVFSNCHNDPYCGRDLIPFTQLLFIWICLFINYILFIKYYNSTFEHSIKEALLVYGFFSFYIFVFIICIGLTTLVLAANWENWEKHGKLFGSVLNIMSSMITTVVWVPQIITTINLRHIGSLSLLSLLIQAPGSLFTFIFQVYISKSSWFVGAPYLVCFIFQLTLLTLGFIFEYRKKKKRGDIYKLYATDDEDTNLILVQDEMLTSNQTYDAYEQL